MTLEELESLIEGCKNGNRLSQQRIYRQFYALGMSVCIRYAHNRDEAEEMCHDGFVKAYTKIATLTEPAAIKGWLRKIFVRAAIDYWRKYRQGQPIMEEISVAIEIPQENLALAHFSADEKLKLVQALPPAYRLAFNLYVIDGYTTQEIATQLSVAEGTVRANIAKARAKLREMIVALEHLENPNHPENQ